MIIPLSLSSLLSFNSCVGKGRCCRVLSRFQLGAFSLFLVTKDHIIPLMSDLRFAPDTLFLVAEEDWRLWKGDCRQGGQPSADEFPSGREGELAAPSEEAGPWTKKEGELSAASASHDTCKGPRRDKAHDPEEGPRGWGRARKGKAEGFESASQELMDIVHFCNAAHRQQHGELIWLGWNASKASSWCPTFGSNLIAVSARGARKLANHWDQLFDDPWHFDLCLKEVLQKQHQLEFDLQCCYLYPSLGGFDDHISAFQNTKQPEVRVCVWETKSRQEGTREHASQDRAFSRSMPWQKWCLKLFPERQKKQFERTLCELETTPLDRPDIWWTAATTVDASFWKPDKERQERGRKKKNKVSLSFQPGTGTSRSKSPTKQWRRKWQFDAPVEEYKKAGHDGDETYGPIRISHQQLLSPEETSDFKTKNAQRRQRNIRANFEMRFFTNNPAKARKLKLRVGALSQASSHASFTFLFSKAFSFTCASSQMHIQSIPSCKNADFVYQRCGLHPLSSNLNCAGVLVRYIFWWGEL